MGDGNPSRKIPAYQIHCVNLPHIMETPFFASSSGIHPTSLLQGKKEIQPSEGLQAAGLGHAESGRTVHTGSDYQDRLLLQSHRVKRGRNRFLKNGMLLAKEQVSGTLGKVKGMATLVISVKCPGLRVAMGERKPKVRFSAQVRQEEG